MNTVIIIAIIVSLVIVITRTASSRDDDKEIPYVDSFPEGSDEHDKTEEDQNHSAKASEMQLRACW
jgi:hypothetical protein